MDTFREHYLDHVAPLELVGHSHSSEGGADRIAANLLVDGEERIVEGEGNGPIDALLNALARGLRVELHVLDYHEHAMSRGEDAPRPPTSRRTSAVTSSGASASTRRSSPRRSVPCSTP